MPRQGNPYLIVLVIISLIVIVLPLKLHQRLRGAIDSCFRPVNSWLMQQDPGSYELHTISEKELKEEIRRLKQQNEECRGDLEKQKDEVHRLRRIFRRFREFRKGVKPRNVVRVAAQVIGRPLNWDKTRLMLNMGAKDGVRVNNGVVCGQGAVGTVVAVGPSVCEVAILTDPGCVVRGRLTKSGAQGILSGTGGELCAFKYVRLARATVTVGDTVMASGMDGIFIDGVILGYVEHVEKGNALFYNIRLRPHVDFDRIESVLILLTPGRPRHMDVESYQ